MCRVFSCVWKTNFVPEKYRPDRSKVICKWVEEDGVLLLVPVGDRVPPAVVEYWKDFARRMGQELRLWDGEQESDLVRSRA